MNISLFTVCNCGGCGGGARAFCKEIANPAFKIRFRRADLNIWLRKAAARQGRTLPLQQPRQVCEYPFVQRIRVTIEPTNCIIASSTRTNAVQSIFKAFSRQMLHNSQLTVVVAGRGRYRRAALCSDNRRRQHRYGSHGACTLFKSTSDKLAQKAIRNSVPNK